jgi:hypothetical protein
LTIRIDCRETEEGVVIQLHGWLGAEALGELESICGSVAGPLRLDLSSLVGTDEAGLGALRRRVAAGARLEGASTYLRLLIEEEGDARTTGPDGVEAQERKRRSRDETKTR